MTTARTELPAPVEGYIATSNAFDLEGLAAWFADDAVVNDARREFVGRPAITRWLAREVVGDHVTMEVTSVRQQHGEVVVAAAMDGDYEKTNLPDPLVLTHYFGLEGDRIVRLIILRNDPTPAWATEG